MEGQLQLQPTPPPAPAAPNFDDEEKEFMSFMNFTEEMYEIIQDDFDNPANQLNSHSHCMDSMDNVGQSYRMVHGYISLLVCIAGIFMNILIIMVLTRKEMRTPINRMLTGLAIADIVVMLEYIPFTLHMYVFDLPKEEQYSYPWAVYVLFHSHLTQILHTINIQLTISMSIWRYLALKGAGTGKNSNTAGRLTLTRCNLCILAAYICPVIICIPNYLTFSIYHRERLYLRTPYDLIFKRQEIGSMANFLKLCEHTSEILNIPMVCESAVVKQDWYTVGLSRLAKANGESLHRINFWIFSVCVKIIPCIVLTTFMVWLVKTLYAAKRRHKMLQGQKSIIGVPPSAGTATPTVNNHHNDNGFAVAGQCGRKGSNNENEDGDGNGNGNGNGVRVSLANNDQDQDKKNRVRVHEQEQQKISMENNNGCAAHVRHGRDDDIAANSVSLLSRHNSDNGRRLRQHDQDHLLPKDQLNGPASILRSASVRVTGSGTGTCTKPSENQLSLPIPIAIAIPSSPSKSSFTNVVSRMSSKRKGSVGAALKKAGGRRHTDRTSKLLIAVLCLFLLTEIPQGIMALLSGIYGEQFFRNCYNTWAEVWDILALINSAINFILYCFMSRQFRLQFRSLLKLDNLWRFSSKAKAGGGSKANGPSQL